MATNKDIVNCSDGEFIDSQTDSSAESVSSDTNFTSDPSQSTVNSSVVMNEILSHKTIDRISKIDKLGELLSGVTMYDQSPTNGTGGNIDLGVALLNLASDTGKPKTEASSTEEKSKSPGSKSLKLCDVASQTLSTGDVVITKIYSQDSLERKDKVLISKRTAAPKNSPK